MDVLNLFDGIACGMEAMNRAGVKVGKYFASEIDEDAIRVSSDRFPKIQHVGSVTGDFYMDLPKIDLLMGGSPCQGFSFAGKHLNFNDPRSILFFEFVKIKNYLNPEFFILENVVMKKEHQDVITELLGVSPIMINSRLVSGQERKRLYWSNIPNVKQPEDRGILFSDIVKNGYCAGMRGRRINEFGIREDYNLNIPTKQYIETRKDGKSNCLTTVDKDNIVVYEMHERIPVKDVDYRYLTVEEAELLQTLPAGYTSSVKSENKRKKLIGNGWNVDTIAHLLGFI